MNLGRDFWLFFAVAFFYDAGFGIYVFLFNLFLLDFHFDERAIGLIGGAMKLGLLVGLFPARILERRFGLWPLFFTCLALAPVDGILRAFWMWEPAQLVMAFADGMLMCSWGICVLTAVARLTTEKNRTSAFSLVFSASMGTGVLGGIVCGYLQQWLRAAGLILQPAEVKRIILIASCGVVLFGVIPLLRLRFPSVSSVENPPEARSLRGDWLRKLKLNSFLLRFLPVMALWSGLLAAFTAFGNVYLSHSLHIPIKQIGLIYSVSDVVQMIAGLMVPLLLYRFGLVNGVIATQIATAITVGLMGFTGNKNLTVWLYLACCAVQWMSTPGLYNLLMNEMPDAERSTGAAMTMFWNSLAASAAVAGTGILLNRFGYPPVFAAMGLIAIVIAILFRLLLAPMYRDRVSTRAAAEPVSQTLNVIPNNRGVR